VVSAFDDTVPSALRSGVDYADPHCWERLAASLATRHVPHPAGGFGRVRCEPAWSWQPTLDDFDLWLVLGGRGAADIAGTDVTFGAGSMFVLRPGDNGSFTQQPQDRLHVSYCHFHFVDIASGRPAPLPADSLPSRWLPRVELARMSALMHRVVSLRRDANPFRQWEASAALAAVLAEVYVQDARLSGVSGPGVDSRIQDVLDFIGDNLHRRPELREVASLVSLSPGRISKLFAEQMGISLRDYAIGARLERARELLTETSMTSGQIAAALGYHDPFLFSRQFKRWYGRAPSQYRADMTRVAPDDR
jgi:AraC-like DNA-binding protein/mannose-6-phosphate isomerase-like protein (cupin superfamily)